MKLLVVARKDAILVVCNRLSKITHFVTATGEISVKELARLFQDNVQKLHGLLESIVSDRRPQFVAEMMKELNKILEIETILLMLYHSQINRQIERINQELKQYLRFFIDHRQKDWPEQLVSAEFAVSNKAHLTTKVSPFMAN